MALHGVYCWGQFLSVEEGEEEEGEEEQKEEQEEEEERMK